MASFRYFADCNSRTYLIVRPPFSLFLLPKNAHWLRTGVIYSESLYKVTMVLSDQEFTAYYTISVV